MVSGKVKSRVKSPAMTWVTLAIFAVTYALISVRKIPVLNLDRPTAALAGAALMVLCGAVSPEEAVAGISFDTLLLLLGMMIVVAYLKLAKFFEYVSTWILRAAKTPRRLLALLVFASGLLSALFVNDTVCVLFTPVVVEAVVRARLDPVPYLIGLVTSANIGSVMTLTGNPQNMLLSGKLAFGKFFLVMLPVGVVSLFLVLAILLLLYRKGLRGEFQAGELVLPQVDRAVIARVFAVLAVVLAGFVLPLERWLPRMEAAHRLPMVAAAGAVLVVLFGRYRPSQAFANVDWGLLIFFSGLFVVIKGVNQTGVLAGMGPLVKTPVGLTVSAVAGSNLVSNVPFVMVARDWVSGEYSCCLLAMASTFAGNLTIVGSVANMIVLELSKEKAPLGFWTYLKAGVPITIVTTAAGYGILWALHLSKWI